MKLGEATVLTHCGREKNAVNGPSTLKNDLQVSQILHIKLSYDETTFDKEMKI